MRLSAYMESVFNPNLKTPDPTMANEYSSEQGDTSAEVY